MMNDATLFASVSFYAAPILHTAPAAGLHWEAVLLPGVMLLVLVGLVIYTVFKERQRQVGKPQQ